MAGSATGLRSTGTAEGEIEPRDLYVTYASDSLDVLYTEAAMDVPITEARENFSEMVNRAAYGHERVRLTRRGKPEAAIISAEELDYFEALEDAQDVLLAREALADPAASVPWSEVKARLGL